MEIKERKLTPKQIKFAEYYAGNGREAAQRAGYKGNDKVLSTIVSKLLANDRVSNRIQDRQAKENKPLIASRQDRERFLTEVMNDPTQKMADRIQATNLLAKMNGDFLTRIEMNGRLDTNHQVVIYLPSRDKV